MTHRSMLPPATVIAAIAMSIPAFASGAVMPHLKVVSTFPAADSVLAASPDRIAVELSEAVELTGSKITLATAAGAPVALGALARDPKMPKLLRADVTTPLAAGGYAVSWRTMSKDGHVVKGAFQFRVGK